MRYYHVLTLQRWMKRKIELTKNLVFASSFLCQCKHSGHSDRCVFHYRTWIFYYTVLISLRRSEFLFWSIIYRGPEIIGNFHFIVIFLLIIIYRGPETSGQSDLQCSLSSAWCKYAAVSQMFSEFWRGMSGIFGWRWGADAPYMKNYWLLIWKWERDFKEVVIPILSQFRHR